MNTNRTSSKSISGYVVSAIILIFLSTLIVFSFQDNFISIDGDLTYHLAVSQSFVREGGLPLIENWDSLPLGRPHLYPPAIHFFLSVLVALGTPSFMAVQLFNGLSIMLGLLLSWLALMKLFSPKAAFYYLLSATSFVTFIVLAGVTIPASFVFLLSPLLLILIRRADRIGYVGAAALMTIIFYTHMIFPYFVAASLIVWAICNRQHLKATFRILLASFLLFIPWLIHILSNLEYLRYFHSSYGTITEITTQFRSMNGSVFIFFIISIILLAHNWKRNIVGKDISYFLAISLVSLPVAYFEFSRYVYSIGIWSMMVAVAYTVANIKDLLPTIGASASGNPLNLRRISSALFVAAFFLSLVWGIYFQSTSGKFSIETRYHLFLEATLPQSKHYLGLRQSIHFNPENLDIADYIEKNTRPDAVIASVAHRLDKEEFFEHRIYVLSQFFAAMSNRKMSNLRSPEYHWQEGMDLSKAAILLVNRDQIDAAGNLYGPIGAKKFHIESYFHLVTRKSDGLMVYANNEQVPFAGPSGRVVLPLWLGWTLLGLACSFIAYAVATAGYPHKR